LILAATLVSLSIAASGADKKSEGFRPAAPEAFPNHQRSGALFLGAAAYASDANTRLAFGKLNPTKYGVLPVLLVVKNSGSETLNLARLRVSYVDLNRQSIENIPPQDIPYLRGPEAPKSPSPIPKGKNKNPLAAMEIETRAFAAKMLPAGESAHGFFYFQAPHRSGAMLYVTGVEEARTGRELFYAEVPIGDPVHR